MTLQQAWEETEQMDPDMVRQQEEAEREALGLLPKQAAVSAPVRAAPTISSAAPMLFVEPEPEPAQEKNAEAQMSLLAGLARLMSVATAGVVLGGGIGIGVVLLFGLSSEEAQRVIFGAGGAVAAICVAASLAGGKLR